MARFTTLTYTLYREVTDLASENVALQQIAVYGSILVANTVAEALNGARSAEPIVNNQSVAYIVGEGR